MRIKARGSLVISSIAVCLVSSCSLAPNGPTNRLRISLSGRSSQAQNKSKGPRKPSQWFAGLRALEHIQEMLGMSALQAGSTLPYGLPTSVPSLMPSVPTGFQCFGVNVTGPGILPPSGALPADTCVPGGMPGSGVYGGLVHSAAGREVAVDVPSGPDRTVQVFGIQDSDGYCPSLPEITSQPLGMHPFQYAYELGRTKVDVSNDATVTVSIHSNSSNAQRLFCDLSSSSVINRQWTRQLGKASSDTSANAVAVDTSGNVFIAGMTNGGLDANSLSGYQDFFLTKYSPSGVKQWTRQLGAALSTTSANAVAVDSSGNVYVAGDTTGGLDGNILSGIHDFFVTKYDSSGVKQWTQQMGLISNFTYAYAVAVDSSGNVFVAGYTNGGLDGNTQTGANDFFVTKYNSSGTKQWTRQLGVASKYTSANGIAVDSSGNIFVAGYTNGGLDGNVLLGSEDFFLTKYNSSGVKQWTRQLGAVLSTTTANGVAIDLSGNVYVAGETMGGLDGNVLSGSQDFFVTKYSSSGVKQWTRQMGVVSQFTFAKGVAIDLSGNVYVSGYTYGGLDSQTLHGVTDLFFTKYDSNGLRQWTQQDGAIGLTTVARAIAIDSSSHVYVAGDVNGSLDGETYMGAGYHDALLTQYQ